MDILLLGWKTGLAGAQSVASMEKAAALLDELRALPEFLFGYVAPGVKPKVIVFLDADAETYGDKRPRGMVEMLIPRSLARVETGVYRGHWRIQCQAPPGSGRGAQVKTCRSMWMRAHWGRLPRWGSACPLFYRSRVSLQQGCMNCAEAFWYRWIVGPKSARRTVDEIQRTIRTRWRFGA